MPGFFLSNCHKPPKIVTKDENTRQTGQLALLVLMDEIDNSIECCEKNFINCPTNRCSGRHNNHILKARQSWQEHRDYGI